MERDDESTSARDDVKAGSRFFPPIGHAGRVVRVLLAWVLSAFGWIYVGWGLGLVFFGPAAVLLAFAGAEPKSRRAVALLSIPTALGLCLALYGLLQGAPGPSTIAHLGEAVAATLITAVAGAPRRRR